MPHWDSTSRPPGVEVRLHAGEEASAADIVVAAPKATSAATFVVVDEDGLPVAGARLENTKAVEWSAWTDADGRATLRWGAEAEWYGKPEAEPVVTVSANGLVNAAARCRPDVKFPPEVRVVLARGTRIEGRVHEPDGRPAIGWTVTAWRSQPEHLVFGGAQTAGDGTFALDGVPTSAVDLEVMHIGDASDGVRGIGVKSAMPGGAPVDVVLKADTTTFGSLVVTTVDAQDGSPVVEAYVVVDCGPGAYPRAVPAAPGTTSYDRVPVGTRTVRADAKGWLPASSTVTIAEGLTTNVRVALVAGTPAVVRLVAPVPLRWSGRPVYVTAARVDAAPGEEGAGFEAVSSDFDSDGVTLRFDALPRGKYRLRCPPAEPGHRPTDYVSKTALDVGPAGKATARATLELVLGGTISVAVTDPEVPRWTPDSAVPSKAAIEVLAVGGERFHVVTGVTGGAHTPLPPGAYIVRLLLPSGRVREAQATVHAGETTTVRFGSP
jgi:hypothetical protein